MFPFYNQQPIPIYQPILPQNQYYMMPQQPYQFYLDFNNMGQFPPNVYQNYNGEP